MNQQNERNHSYKQLVVWNKAIVLTVRIYDLTTSFPDSEKFGLISQMRRAAVSIPSNIAEGQCRSTEKDFKQFLHIAYGSCAELDTQLTISKLIPDIPKKDYLEIENLLDEVMRMLNALIHTLNK